MCALVTILSGRLVSRILWALTSLSVAVPCPSQYWVDQVLGKKTLLKTTTFLFFSTWRSPGLHCSSIQEKTQPESSAKLCIETCWLNDWKRESMKTWIWNAELFTTMYSFRWSNRPETLGILSRQEQGLLSLSAPFQRYIFEIGPLSERCLIIVVPEYVIVYWSRFVARKLFYNSIICKSINVQHY